MNIVGLFSGFSMFLAWGVYAGISRLTSKKNAVPNIWLMLGWIGALFLLSLLVEYGIAWSGGFLEEQIAHANRVNAYWGIFIGFEFFVGIMTTLALFRGVRSNKVLRAGQLFFVILYLFAYLLLDGFRYSGFALTELPGWHATIVTVGNEWGLAFWLALIVISSALYELVRRLKN